MTHSQALSAVIGGELNGMKDDSPRPLLVRVNQELDDSGSDEITLDQLVDVLLTDSENGSARVQFYIQLGKWVGAETLNTPKVTMVTDSGTPERRRHVFTALGLPESAFDALAEGYELAGLKTSTMIVSAEDWTKWYPRETQKTFYWGHYKDVLQNKGFDERAIDELDKSTSQIVGRLADPTQVLPYQSKGMVVGHVQSGKTANFAGTIAKAIDAGYKLVIVLTGTIEMLRAQTQKRLDKELLGQENVLGGVAKRVADLERQIASLDRYDPKRQKLEADLKAETKDVDYVVGKDEDWKLGKFAKFGVLPSAVGAPAIRRLTTVKKDYQGLRQFLTAVDFDQSRPDLTKPIYDPANIDRVPVLFAVVKKNTASLRKLRNDLQGLETDLEDIPALIIDDEADQASVNTKRPKPDAPKSKEENDRTAINGHISAILRSMPRCQYLAYTATPFANVFVDPDDSEDIFPKDFIVALEPSPEYMGAKAYHDLDGEPEHATYRTSNELAYYRPISVDVDGFAEKDGLSDALDSYVLAGAIKLWRAKRVSDSGSLKHHTMLVHEGAKQDSHEKSAERVVGAWRTGGFSSPDGLQRLRDLWERDFEPVSGFRAAGAPVPQSFDELKDLIAEVVRLVDQSADTDGKSNPVVVVNGNKNSVYKNADIDFDGRNGVWKIIVGGAKLSRGFTVEGLTTTVFTRVTMAADTLTQMGRWYGYRKNYRDLVRLFMGDGINKKGRGADISLYDTFTDIARDEEDFREDLEQYAGLDEDGKPQITPMDVAPLVLQRVPWMKPTGANKMYNSMIVEQGRGGRAKDLFQLKARDTGVHGRNLELLEQRVFPYLSEIAEFVTDGGTSYRAAYGIFSVNDVEELLRSFEFLSPEVYAPTIKFIKNHAGVKKEGIDDFVVFLPFVGTGAQRQIPGLPFEEPVTILKRTRRDRGDFSGSSVRQRPTGEVIAGSVAPSGEKQEDGSSLAGGEEARRLHAEGRGRRGALMITLAAEQRNPEGGTEAPTHSVPGDLPPVIASGCNDVASLLTITMPQQAAPKGVIVRTVRVPDRANDPIVDNPAAKPKA